jgi:hypothetical protein
VKNTKKQFIVKGFSPADRTAGAAKTNRNMYRLITLIFLLALASCQTDPDKIPADILPKEKMTGILMDIHIAEAGIRLETQQDSLAQKATDYYHFIYKKYNVSEEDFRRSFRYYSEHPKQLEQIYQDMINEMSKKESEALNSQN